MVDPIQHQAKPGFDLNRPTIIGLLMAAGYFTLFTPIIAVVLCYVWQGEQSEGWEISHYTYHIRTFWGYILGMVVGTILLLVFIGVFVYALIGIWGLVRVVVQLVNAQKSAPMPDPKSLLI